MSHYFLDFLTTADWAMIIFVGLGLAIAAWCWSNEDETH